MAERSSRRGKDSTRPWLMCITVHHSPSSVQLRGLDHCRQTCTHTQTYATSPSQLTLTLSHFTRPPPFSPTPPTNSATYNICNPYRSPPSIWIYPLMALHSSPSHLSIVFSSPLGHVCEGQKYPRPTRAHNILFEGCRGCKNRIRSWGGLHSTCILVNI